MIMGFNGIAPHAEPDFDAYPMIGFKADHFHQVKVNNQFNNYTWLINNDDGIPLDKEWEPSADWYNPVKVHEFIQTLEIPQDAKDRLLELRPDTYLGKAPELARRA
jgi:hypothetical protein